MAETDTGSSRGPTESAAEGGAGGSSGDGAELLASEARDGREGAAGRTMTRCYPKRSTSVAAGGTGSSTLTM